MDREKLEKISKYCKKMKEIEENKLLTKEFKTVELEKLKKKRKLMDKLVYRDIKKKILRLIIGSLLLKRKFTFLKFQVF